MLALALPVRPARVEIGFQQAADGVEDLPGKRHVMCGLAVNHGRLLRGIPGADAIRGERPGIGQPLGDPGGYRLSEAKQVSDVMGLPEVHLVSDEQRLQSFLGGLLGVKAGYPKGRHGGCEDHLGSPEIFVCLGKPQLDEVPLDLLRRSRRGLPLLCGPGRRAHR